MILCLISITWYWNIGWNSAEILVEKNHPNFKLNYDICIYKLSIKSGGGYNKPHLIMTWVDSNHN